MQAREFVVKFHQNFTVFQEKLTLSAMYPVFLKSICDKTAAKRRLSLLKVVELDVETTFRYIFPSGELQCFPLTIPEFFTHNLGI